MDDQTALPSADEFFGPAPAAGAPNVPHLPTADQFFGPEIGKGAGDDPLMHASPITLDMIAKSPVGRIASAFGQGAQDGFGGGQLGLSDETKDYLTKAGIMPDLNDGQTSLGKAFWQGVLLPAVSAGDLAWRGIKGVTEGAAAGAAETAEQIHPGGAAATTNTLQALTDPGLIASMEPVGPAGEAAALALKGVGPVLTTLSRGANIARAAEIERTARTIAEARELNVIGPGGEAAYMGQAEVPPLTPEEEAAPVADAAANEHAAPDTAKPTPVTGDAAQPAPTGPSIHDIARQVNPDAFAKYDPLVQQQQTLRGMLNDLSYPSDEAMDQLEAQRDALNTQADAEKNQAARRQLRAQAREVQSQHNEMYDRRMALLDGTATDTPEMAQIRRSIQETDYQLRDLAPDISAAYREAEARMNGEFVGPMPQEAPAEPVQPVSSVEPPQTPEAPPAAPAEAVAPQPAVSFTTAKGSTYEVHEDGTTTRNKSFHPEHGAADVGIKPRSETTFYVTSDEADELGLIQTKGGHPMQIAKLPDGRWGIRYTDGPDKGKFERRTVVTPKTEPEVGLTPVELWDDGKNVHFGNAITEVHEVPAGPAAPAMAVADDISRQLVAAGRPQEEADAAGAVVQALNETRAQRLGITPEQSYEEAKAPIQAAEGGVRERGRTVIQNGQAIIRMTKNADASTFIHETGHQWLNQMFKDAADPRAIDSVRTDAATVKGWLGIEGEKAPTRAQHEKFARGFERYMMEGTAPSQGLASVFGKFKNWLTNIYQTVGRLRAPINDDIRAVFDRMLATNPERQPVIAAEREAPTMADLHEADAEATEPAHAATVADVVRDERDQHAAATLPGEIDDERRAERGAAEAGRGEPGGPLSDRGPNAPEPVGANAGEPQGVGAVGEGGSGAAEQGAGQRPKPKREPAGAAKQSVEPEPWRPYEDAHSADTDLAGNIRLDNWNLSDESKQLVKDVVAENKDFIEQRRGVVSDAEVLRTAELTASSPADMRRLIDGAVTGKAFNAEENKALQLSIERVLQDVRNATDITTYTEKRLQLQELVGVFSGATAESGRALRALRKTMATGDAMTLFQRFGDITGKSAEQVAEEMQAAKAMGTPGQLSKFLKDSAEPTLKDKIQYVQLNGLISGPVTHMTYEVAAAITAIEEALVERPLAALSGSLREAMAGEPIADRVQWGEVRGSLVGLVKGSRDGTRAALEAWRSNMTTPLPGELEAQGLMEGGAGHPRPQAIGGPIGTAIGIPGRIVTALHSFNRAVFYEMELQSRAVRQAVGEGLDGARLNRRIADLTANPTPEMMDGAVNYANELAYMKKPAYGSFAWNVEQMANKNLITKAIVPFSRVATNIIDRAYVQRTPVGVLSEKVRADLLGRNGGAAADLARAKMVAGSLIGVTMAGLAVSGLATAAGPADPNQRRLWLLDHQPYSIKVGDQWVPYKRLGHIGMLMGMGAGVASSLSTLHEEGAMKAALQFAHEASENVVDESWMAGLSNVLNVIENPQRAGNAAFSFASEFIPFSALTRQIAHALDPEERSAKGPAEELQAMTPFWREQLAPRRDLWGNPVASRESFLLALPHGIADAMGSSQGTNDHLAGALASAGYYPSAVERRIRGVPLSDQQYDDYARIAGRLAKQRIGAVVAQPGFPSLPQPIRNEILKRVMESTRAQGQATVMAQNPSIIEAARETKLNGMHAP